MNEEEFDVITLTFEDGTSEDCAVLAIFTVEELERDYVAMVPVEDMEKDDIEIYLYRYSEGDGEEPQLEPIDDEEELEIVTDAFDEMLDEEEFNDLS